MSKVREFSEESFQQEVLENDLPVMVDFWAPWCGPCKALGPVVDKLAAENQGRLEVGKINVDDNQQLASRYEIRGVPTLAFFRDGKEIGRVVGALSRSQLQKVIDDVIG
ncbi:MAG: thioredoxin [Syntrophomonadaceae bacterium]|nr:thioredoxin [Syntrophomonadaceae bacterium]